MRMTWMPMVLPDAWLRVLAIDPTRVIDALAKGGQGTHTETSAKRLLQQAQREGVRLPLYGCANPCPRRPQGCPGFDPRRGCGGHCLPESQPHVS
ncbi:MAG: hypothetical protein KDI48_02180 [Xanthomonadales bacterium]|nr:hypothetical protein [Xanthomonadales bacterium]